MAVRSDTTGERAHPRQPGVVMPIALTPRQFAAIIGGVLAVAGLVVLFFMPVSATYDAGLFGPESVDCGSALVTNNVYGDASVSACSDALGERRAWGWPLAIGGGILAAAALLVHSPKLLSQTDDPE